MANWRSSDFYQAIRAAPVGQADLEYFRSHPVSKPWLDDPHYSPVLYPGRVPQVEGEDELFGKTLNTNRTIVHWLTLVSNATLPKPGHSTQPGSSSQSSGAENPDAIYFLHIGAGVNGFRETAHGGLLCAILDETLGFLVELLRHSSSSSREILYTANLNINYRQPVMTPDVIIVRTWLEKKEGRKWRLKGLLENSKGELCADVEGLWIAARAAKL